jgi:acetyl-CoA carboxylase biotin carboxyl carrier protein
MSDIELSYREVTEILDLVQRIECTELHLDYGGFSLRIVRGPVQDSSLSSPRPGAEVAGTAGNVAGSGGADGQIEPSLSPSIAKVVTGGSHEADVTRKVPASWVAIRAPMVATFYAAPSPGADPFVAVGDKVAEGSTVCMLEVMKLYNEIKAECAGTVARIEVVNGQLVEHDQVLMWIEPL